MKKYIILILSASMIMSCGKKQESTENQINSTSISPDESIVELTEAQSNNAGIELGKIEERSVSSLLKVNGIIDVPPQNMVSISAPLGGYLKSTKLLPGMHISRGEVIAIMEDQQYITLQQEYLIGKSKLSFVEEEFYRQEELNKSKANSDKVYQQARVDFNTQKIIVKSLSEKLKMIGINPEKLDEKSLSRQINITSPIDGFVTHVNINIGKYANPSDILFELVNPKDIHLALQVYEKDIDKLYIGQKLMAYTNTNPEKKFPCEVILIGKDLSQNRSLEIHCHFDMYDKSLIPGMYMNAEIAVNTINALTIAAEGIVRFEGNQYIFIKLSDRKYQMQEVTTFVTENGFTQIALPSNVDKNQMVVTKGAYTLLMKMKNTDEE